MSILCERAEELLREKNIRLSPEKRATLATYDEDTQVRWIVNPMMEWLLQSFTNQLIAGRQMAATQSQPVTTEKKTTTINDKKPPQTNKPVPKPEPEPEPEPDDMGLGLFD